MINLGYNLMFRLSKYFKLLIVVLSLNLFIGSYPIQEEEIHFSIISSIQSSEDSPFFSEIYNNYRDYYIRLKNFKQLENCMQITIFQSIKGEYYLDYICFKSILYRLNHNLINLPPPLTIA